MNIAIEPRATNAQKLLRIDPQTKKITSGKFATIVDFFRAGDVLVVNDAATLPASLRGTTSPGEPIEIRLLGKTGNRTWDTLLFGAGDWRTPTEGRGKAPRLEIGEKIFFDRAVAAVEKVSQLNPRIVTLTFLGEENLWTLLYRLGKPIQYSYLKDGLPLWAVQTPFASEPWAVEMPSASRPLKWEHLLALRARGVEVAAITHAAGLSSSGENSIDAQLPLPERYKISAATAEVINRAKRVIASGTSVVRALESNGDANGVLRPGQGTTDLRIQPGYSLKIVDGLLTGIHVAGESHFQLIAAFADAELANAALAVAANGNYLLHEFGDSSLILAD